MYQEHTENVPECTPRYTQRKRTTRKEEREMKKRQLEELRRDVGKVLHYPSYDLTGDNPEEIQARANAIILMRYGKTPVARERMAAVKELIERRCNDASIYTDSGQDENSTEEGPHEETNQLGV